ncbi:hypothetical protein [Microbulbifer sp. MCCC 1A16149]|uniref:hypothetical protein n=1 Tax=Microbulbifer sp. MCCC 1A16149 TaxID=3411322 RepID=UPI003D131081
MKVKIFDEISSLERFCSSTDSLFGESDSEQLTADKLIAAESPELIDGNAAEGSSEVVSSPQTAGYDAQLAAT